MTIDQFLSLVKDNPETVEFEQTMNVIAQHRDYTPTRFTNGLQIDRIVNHAGTNEGSCRLFAFARQLGLGENETLACFGRFYREDVLQYPEGKDHGNIRIFMRHGWKGIQFDGEALQPKPGKV